MANETVMYEFASGGDSPSPELERLHIDKAEESLLDMGCDERTIVHRGWHWTPNWAGKWVDSRPLGCYYSTGEAASKVEQVHG